MVKKCSPWGLPILLAVAVLTILAGSPGCGDGSALRGRNHSATVTPPTPEESFALILETFRRGIETGVGGVSSGFVTNEEGTRSRFTVNNSVSHEIIPPEGEQPYRATITVTSRASYSLTREMEEQDERQNDGARDNAAARDSSRLFPGAGGVDVLDPDLVRMPTEPQAKPGGSASRPLEDTVTRHVDEDVRNYELIYDDGRWRLTDETSEQLDERTEQAVINAFREALKTQV